MTPHVVLVAASGKASKTADKATALWSSPTFCRRVGAASDMRQRAGVSWGILSPQGLLLPGATHTPHKAGPPPPYNNSSTTFCHWQQLVRAGLRRLVESAPELGDVERLRIEAIVPPSWIDSLARALPEHRISLRDA